MRTVAILFVLALALGPAVALAQPPASGQPTGPVTLPEALKNAHNGIKRNIVEAAEKMPEADYSFKVAGPAPEARNYGQFVGHLANANYGLCSQAKGEKSPKAGTDYEKTTSKAELVQALKDAVAYCDTVYDAVTESNVMEMAPTQPRPRPRIAILFGNVAHNNEHYGNLIILLRLKGLLPPSTERAQQQRRPSGQ